MHSVVQGSFCMACPSQGSPPLRGAGLVQLRVRFWKPRPQRLLHTDHSVHVDQPPFTVATDQISDTLNTFIYTCIWTQQHLISLLLKSSPLRWTQRSQMTTDTCFRSTFRRLTATVCEKDVRNVCLLCVLIDYCNLTVLASSLQCWI